MSWLAFSDKSVHICQYSWPIVATPKDLMYNFLCYVMFSLKTRWISLVKLVSSFRLTDPKQNHCDLSIPKLALLSSILPQGPFLVLGKVFGSSHILKVVDDLYMPIDVTALTKLIPRASSLPLVKSFVNL